jgi:hypothetical protein
MGRKADFSTALLTMRLLAASLEMTRFFRGLGKEPTARTKLRRGALMVRYTRNGEDTRGKNCGQRNG